jgi:hypothetical protein
MAARWVSPRANDEVPAVNPSPTNLTATEIADLTHKTRPTAQRRALLAMGIPSKVRPDGTIAVDRTAYEAAMGVPTGVRVQDNDASDVDLSCSFYRASQA